MLENIPSQSTMTELLGQSLYEVWQELCSTTITFDHNTFIILLIQIMHYYFHLSVLLSQMRANSYYPADFWGVSL